MSMFDSVQNPFECQLTDLIGLEQEELAELSSDRKFCLEFNRKSLLLFWMAYFLEYPLLSMKVVNLLLLFAAEDSPTDLLLRISFSCSHCHENQIEITTEHLG